MLNDSSVSEGDTAILEDIEGRSTQVGNFRFRKKEMISWYAMAKSHDFTELLPLKEYRPLYAFKKVSWQISSASGKERTRL